MSKHTPGPWSVYNETDAFPGIEAEEAGITIVLWGDAGEPDLGVHGQEREQQLANANLIAGAPDLLAACEALHVRLFREQRGRDDSPWAAPLELLAAAIAKAEGRS